MSDRLGPTRRCATSTIEELKSSRFAGELPVFLGDWLGRRAWLTPDKVALVDAANGNLPITYEQWNQAANRSALLLRLLAVGKGDRVAILAHNCVEFLDIWFACGKLGAILQALNWRLTAGELMGLIREAGPKVLVYGPEFLDKVRALRQLGMESVTRLALAVHSRAFPEDRCHDERDGLGDAAPPPVEARLGRPLGALLHGGDNRAAQRGHIDARQYHLERGEHGCELGPYCG